MTAFPDIHASLLLLWMALVAYMSNTCVRTAIVPTEDTVTRSRSIRRASIDHRSPSGRKTPQRRSIRNMMSPPLRIIGFRTCSEINRSHETIVASLVR